MPMYAAGGEHLPKINRREFLKWIGSLAFLSALTSLFRLCPKKEVIRPPGAVSEEKFLAVCLRCERCVEACPRDFIKTAGLEEGITNIGTPYMEKGKEVFEHGGVGTSIYCASCMCCAKACPADALVEGTAEVDKSSCIKCRICADFCPIKAIEIDEDGWPVVLEDKCNGCGYCSVLCPLMPPAIYVKRK